MSNATTHIETEKRSAERSRSKLVPELRFKEFEVDWKIENLGSVGSIVNGLTYSPDDINPEGVLVLRSSNVQNGMLYLEDNVYVIAEKFNPVFVDDILICVRNGSKRLIGKNTLITENVKGVAFGAFMAIYRSDFNRFLYYFFSSEQYYKEIHKNLGATINSINGSDLRKFKVGFPSLPEQQKIACFLSTIDEKIQQLTKKKELLEQYKKGVMQQLFSGQLRFKPARPAGGDDNGNPYPDWEEKYFKDIVIEYRLGGNYTNTEEETIYPLIKMGNLGRGKIKLKKLEYIPIDEEIDSKDKIEYGDLFFNTRNTLDLVGKVSIWRNELPEAYYNSNLMYLKFEDNFFMNYRLNSYEGIKGLKRFATGTTSVAAIYTKDLLKLPLNMPCLEEQQKIAIYLSGIDAKIEAVNNQITQTQTFKKGLLQQLFV